MKDQLSCSEITKRKIAAALKELMQTTPFEKITVSDISQTNILLSFSGQIRTS